MPMIAAWQDRQLQEPDVSDGSVGLALSWAFGGILSSQSLRQIIGNRMTRPGCSDLLF